MREYLQEEGYPVERPGRKLVPVCKFLDAEFWIFGSGARWRLLPQSYPNYKAVRRCFVDS